MPEPPRTPPTQQHRVLIEWGQRFQWRQGAEVGTLKGKTLNLLLEGVPTLSLVVVDQWRHLPESEAAGHETYTRFNMSDAEARVRAIAARFPDRCRILKGESVAMATLVPDDSLDFVFIDALHTEEATIANIRAWAPKVKASGLITGHDWWWPSVRAALDRTLPGWTEQAESVWMLPKSEYHQEEACL